MNDKSSTASFDWLFREPFTHVDGPFRDSNGALSMLASTGEV